MGNVQLDVIFWDVVHIASEWWLFRHVESLMVKIDLCRQLFGPITTAPLTRSDKNVQYSFCHLHIYIQVLNICLIIKYLLLIIVKDNNKLINTIAATTTTTATTNNNNNSSNNKTIARSAVAAETFAKSSAVS